MRTAVISDIHGHLDALLAVLDDAAGMACDRVVCLGDCVDGGKHDLEVVRELMRRGILTLKGNHDEFHGLDEGSAEAKFLGGLGQELSEEDVLYTHISPRPGDRKIADRFEAWNVFDETKQRVAFVGHVHIPLLFRESGTAGAAEVIRIEYGRPIKLRSGERYIACPGSVALGRDGVRAPRYIVYDDDAGSVEFRMVGGGE